MPRLVLDASIAVKWLNPHEPLADKANLIRNDYERGHVSLIVPAFWEYEVANGLNKAVARGQLSEEEGREAIALLLALPAQKEPLPSPQKSYELARKYQRSVYDSWYLHLAEMTGCEFWTADQKLYNALTDTVPWVRWRADYQSQP
ncbi:MAG: type II toxin-antitoxin system VapC family toxin [Deltaproteobacteria bacterium]|nr:type II toxin-antitoxin system VapC family toxin [Deltaproteobacteria bacterium]